MEVALDTNAYSDWLRSGLWDDRISQASRIIMPMIVIGELFHVIEREGIDPRFASMRPRL